MLIPKSLTMKAIGRYVDEQTVYFDQMGQIVQFDGDNKNTGGSSGSGKSTFFVGMEYNLGINDMPVTVLQSRLTKEGIYTNGLYDWDGKEVNIIRGKGKFSVTIDGETVEGSAKLAEEKIDAILGMSRDLFRAIFHKRQKEGGFFLEMTPKDVHEFLTNVLSLDEEQKKVDKLDSLIKKLALVKETTTVDLKAARSGLTATQEAILALGLAPVRDMHQSVVLTLKTKADDSLAILAATEVKHKEQLALLDTQRPTLLIAPRIPAPVLNTKPFDRSRLELSEVGAKTAKEQADAIVEAERQRKATVDKNIQLAKMDIQILSHNVKVAISAKKEAQELATEIKSIRECVCPTCQQSWVAEAAKVKEAELLAKLAVCKTSISDGIKAEQDINALNAKILDLEKQLEPQSDPRLIELTSEITKHTAIIIGEKVAADVYAAQQNAENEKLISANNAENARLQAEINAKNQAASDAFSTKQQALRYSHIMEMDQARGQADVDRRAFEAAVNKLKAYEDANARYVATLTTLKKQEEQYTQKVGDMTQTLGHTEAQLAIAEETKRAVKSFMSCSFDEALEEIGDSATRILRAIPNMANSTVQFQGIRETQQGKIKEEVTAVISMDGEEGIDIRSLSGGERSSADLAIDLAVIELIENRSNKGISVFILDEPFTGLDTVSIEMVLELLKNANLNKKLIIVDHNPEVKQMVDSRIVAVREGLTSKIVQ